MNIHKLKKLSLKTQFSVLAVAVLVFGVFVSVRGAQQNQENRSKAASIVGTGGNGNCGSINTTTDDLRSDNCTIPGGLNGSIYGSNNTIQGGLGGWPANI
ncbi:MAG: hypothetical protein ACREGC_03955, partial [Minisyncoccia bacterium]